MLSGLGCASSVSKQVGSIDGDFVPYVAKFLSYGQTYGRHFNIDHLVVTFGVLDGSIAGECYMGHEYIVISTYWWPLLNDTQREILILHELGHCELGLGHDNNIIMAPLGNIEESIMYPYIVYYVDYLTYQNYYLEQLFTGHGSF